MIPVFTGSVRQTKTGSESGAAGLFVYQEKREEQAGIVQGDLENRIRQYMAEQRMLEKGDAVCVGLSGGADSVCLFRVLAGLAEQDPEFALTAVHVNHQLRGRESDGDEEFVRRLCEELDVPLFVYSYPVAEIAADRGIGTEEAGRLVRREAYENCRNDHSVTKIALAHQANDLAETFLFHAARGSSAAGLAGIRPVSGPVIRPLLCVTRPEIEAWLTQHGFRWRTDASNEEDGFTRNGIRHHVIPYLEEHVNAQAVRHICEAARDLEEVDEFLQQVAREKQAESVRFFRETEPCQGTLPLQNRRSGTRLERTSPSAGASYAPFAGTCFPEEADHSVQSALIKNSVLNEASVLQGNILLNTMEEICGKRKDLGRIQVRQLQELFDMPEGKRIVLPYGMLAVREEDGIRISSAQGRNGSSAEESTPEETFPAMAVTGEGVYRWRDWTFHCRILNAGEDGVTPESIPFKQYTKWLNYDRIERNLVLRGREGGDRLTIDEAGNTKKLKDYFIDEKIPQVQRGRTPLLASGSEVYWVVGGRIGESAKVRSDTKRILEIRAERTDYA